MNASIFTQIVIDLYKFNMFNLLYVIEKQYCLAVMLAILADLYNQRLK